MSNKIRVLHILASNKFSGAENVVCQIINLLDGNGYCESFYCSPNGTIQEQLAERGIIFEPIKKLSVGELKKTIKRVKPDVIHAHDIKASVVSTLATNKIPVVAHIHGSDFHRMKKITAKSLMFRLIAPKLKHIFWVSKSCLDVYKFKKSVVPKSSILYNIISLDELNNRTNACECAESYDIAYIGRLEPVKNPIRLLEIMKLSVVPKPDLKCVIMGDGSLKKECEDFISKNNLSKNIIMKGFVSNPCPTLKNSKILLMSSISEGTPMCALEALGLGVPVISTPTDGLVDLIKNGENGYLYSKNEEAVEYITEILLGNKNLSTQCLEFSKKYNNKEEYMKKINSVYSLVSGIGN